MRWILIDEFLRIECGQTAIGRRNVTRAEEALVDSYPCFPVMPSPLLIEMMAQVGGVLAGATIDFAREVVLAKVTDAEFPKAVRPPSALEIHAKLTDLGEDAAMTECHILENDETVAKASIFFGLFKALGDGGKSMVFSKDFMESFSLKQVIKKTNEAGKCAG